MRITRTAKLPDPVRVARCRRAPELGPRILFFSGGSALRATSRVLKSLSHNSVHLITPFDSGGSSARLRDAFPMPSVGDLRNRLLALADETVLGAPEIHRLFSYRFPDDGDLCELGRRLEHLVSGADSMIADIPSAMRRIVRTHLRMFAERMPADFDLRGASIGNLVLAGGYLNNDLDAKARTLITGAELIVFPMGSFYSSVIATLLPAGVGSAIVAAGCPKIYVPNTATDPEQIGMSVADAVGRILEFVRRDAGREVPARSILDCVVVDAASGAYLNALDLERVRSWGIDVLDISMVGADERRRIAPDVLAELLVSMC